MLRPGAERPVIQAGPGPATPVDGGDHPHRSTRDRTVTTDETAPGPADTPDPAVAPLEWGRPPPGSAGARAGPVASAAVTAAVQDPTALDVVGIGNALVDVLTHEDEAFIDAHGLVRGAMTLIDTERAEALYEAMGPGIEVSGGSAANTISGIASFGGKAAYIGRVFDDQLGAVFAHDMRATGVVFRCRARPRTARPPGAASSWSPPTPSAR